MFAGAAGAGVTTAAGGISGADTGADTGAPTGMDWFILERNASDAFSLGREVFDVLLATLTFFEI